MEKNYAHFFFFWYLIRCLLLMIIDFVGFLISYSFLQAHKKAYWDLQSLSWTLQISQWEALLWWLSCFCPSSSPLEMSTERTALRASLISDIVVLAAVVGPGWLIPLMLTWCQTQGNERFTFTYCCWQVFGEGRRDQSRNEYCWAEP